MPLTAHNPIPTIHQLTSLPATDNDAWVLGETPRVRQLAHHAEKAAEVQCTVLLTGETGTGKELWAKALHRMSSRSHAAFVPVNCAALTPTLAESQLFGHEKGAFTGAAGRSLGVFRAAEGGVVFLDEVGEMPLELQPKLLRTLQQNEVTPVGASNPQRVNVQIIAATNRDLEVEVAEGRFREDLYYRLNMVELKIPALRDRSEDIPNLIAFFSDRFAHKYSRPRWNPTADTLADFLNYAWPGNVRQLAHVIEQGYVLDCEPTLPNQRVTTHSSPQLPCTDLNRLRDLAVSQALRATGGHKGRAAKLLGVHPNTMTRLLAGRDHSAN
ncbi:sigma-54 interaction domain-containing protein [Botrimarina hoheduenensis]|uniref:Transcriptional regulatory protein QseF n=1 Tax=Botrimarina hoheduenensis TaxID=2528000 RepID=A0A5C5VVP3_9BACT|nr:sigma-54 dependent transcriptional regulator [Botrimarina hoheduenensis]TWT42668.1 Transcriptional regulatory protein QseF [Botrimarina hoheduenensis]